jgi:hypothetical protein
VILAPFGHVGQQRQLAWLGEISGKLAVEHVRELLIAAAFEAADSLDGLAPPEAFAVGCGRLGIGDVQRLAADSVGGKLAL